MSNGITQDMAYRLFLMKYGVFTAIPTGIRMLN